MNRNRLRTIRRIQEKALRKLEELNAKEERRKENVRKELRKSDNIYIPSIIGTFGEGNVISIKDDMMSKEEKVLRCKSILERFRRDAQEHPVENLVNPYYS